ncbi:MAG TPA: choice-of-anchor D domain-containing protein [Acidimicrobiia bacterium]|nr:choice-of-anchor D domain-containing protein [Acidimicrobiia bacterium]
MHSLTKPHLSLRRAATVAIIFTLVASLVALAPPARGADGDLDPQPPVDANELTLDLGDIRADAKGRSKSRNLVNLQNGGSTDITITNVSIGGSNAGQFSREGSLGPPVTIGGGETFDFWVEFAPTSAGTKSAVVSIENDGNVDPLVIDLEGRGVTSEIWYRVNAGGNFRQGTVDWVRDSPSVPSPYLNATDIGNTVRPPGTIDSVDGTVPSGTPIQLFEAHRYDPPGGDDMAWNFPVDPGTYEVRLYFAETEDNIGVGERVFDVVLEGSTVLDNFDVVAATGQATGTMRGFVVASDGNIDIDFGRMTQNPFIAAIEVIARPDDPEPPGDPEPVGEVSSLGASPSPVAFGTVAVGETVSRTVTITNQGDSNDTVVTLDPSISGSPAFSFTSGGGEVTLSPGDSTQVVIAFSPNNAGSTNGTLVIDHDGANDPLEVSLTGTGGVSNSGFKDIADSTFITEINWLAATGITKGCNPPANDLFCPEDFVTRGQMSAFLHRALDDVLTPGPAVEFIDDNGSTFEADIEWLGATGVTKGCNPPTNDRFCPDEPVTREQMAAFLYRALSG